MISSPIKFEPNNMFLCFDSIRLYSPQRKILPNIYFWDRITEFSSFPEKECEPSNRHSVRRNLKAAASLLPALKRLYCETTGRPAYDYSILVLFHYMGASPNLSSMHYFSTSDTDCTLLVDRRFPNYVKSLMMILFGWCIVLTVGRALLVEMCACTDNCSSSTRSSSIR